MTYGAETWIIKKLKSKINEFDFKFWRCCRQYQGWPEIID